MNEKSQIQILIYDVVSGLRPMAVSQPTLPPEDCYEVKMKCSSMIIVHLLSQRVIQTLSKLFILPE